MPHKLNNILAKVPSDIEIAQKAAKDRVEYGDKNGSPKELARQTAKENLDQAERMYALKGVAEADIIRQRRAYQSMRKTPDWW